MTSVVICSHVVFVDNDDVFGPAHAVSSFLKLKNKNHIYIKHSLYDSRPSIVEYINKEKRIKKLWLPKFFPSPLRHLAETVSVILFIGGLEKVKLFIGVNPLNAFAGIVAKKLGKVDKVIFYTADYAYNRFDNKILNSIYHTLDLFAIRNSDSVWNVSSRIRKIRSGQGLSESNNIFVPNAPILRLVSKFFSRDKRRRGLVLMANFTPAINYDLIVKTLADLRVKYKDVSLSFIGSGEKENGVKDSVKKLRLDKNVYFLGQLKHDDALKEVGRNSIGLAPYVSKWPWTAFGDSLKAREYAALGLPVIMNKGISTGDDIDSYKAGFIINLNRRELTRVIDRLLSDNNLYLSMRQNALKMARDFDLEKILNKHLLRKYNI